MISSATVARIIREVLAYPNRHESRWLHCQCANEHDRGHVTPRNPHNQHTKGFVTMTSTTTRRARPPHANRIIVAFGTIGIVCFGASTLLAQCQNGRCGCKSRGTLFQWSYGTSFSGGPDLSEPLVTDRPDFTEASSTVGRGVTQFEMGYLYVNDREGNDSFDGHAYPDLLLRQGLFADWFELRIGWTYLSDRETIGNVTTTNDRSSDLYVGTKIGLTPQEGVLPEMALIPQMFLPISEDPILGGGEVLPGVNWIYAWELNDWLSIAGSSQINRALDDATGEPYGLIAQSAVAGFSLTDELGAFSEWFCFIPDGADTVHTQHYYNGGFTYLLCDNVQFDIKAGIGLSDHADDFFLGTGLSVRFP